MDTVGTRGNARTVTFDGPTSSHLSPGAALGAGAQESPAPERVPSFAEMVRALTREARAGRCLPFVVELDGLLVGQVTVSGITWGSTSSAP